MGRTPLTHRVLELRGLHQHGRSTKALVGKRKVPNTSCNYKVVLPGKISMDKVKT